MLTLRKIRRFSRWFREVSVAVMLCGAIAANTLGGTHTDSHATLKDAYEAALKNTEIVASQEALTRQTEERLSQATGRMMPNVSLLASYLRQDQAPAAGGIAAFTRADQSNARINLTQPLFRGFGEFAERRSRQAQLKAAELQGKQAKLALYSAVAAAYYGLLSAQKDLENLKSLNELTDRRAAELRNRVGIGRSRKGELLTAQAQIATLEAQIESAQSSLEKARETFHFVTGLPSPTQVVDPGDTLPPNVPPLATMLLVIESRPDVEARKAVLEAADESITVARSGHYPSLDFGANYYLRRTGVLENSKWDLGVQLTIPLFQGGIVLSQVQEAHERKREQELALSLGRREAAREIRTLHQEVSSQVAQHRALKKALEIAENNYDVQNRDYKFGLATHLDVLQALNAFQETKRLLDRTRFQAMAAYASLTAATGSLE